jgi:hypothetical protein
MKIGLLPPSAFATVQRTSNWSPNLRTFFSSHIPKSEPSKLKLVRTVPLQQRQIALSHLRIIISLLFVALWLPASSHAFLEYSGLIHQRHADHDSSSGGSHGHDNGDHPAADGHCLPPSTDSGFQSAQASFLPFWISFLATGWELELLGQRSSSGLPPPDTIPPELIHRWQFSFRTALPARAPSIAS